MPVVVEMLHITSDHALQAVYLGCANWQKAHSSFVTSVAHNYFCQVEAFVFIVLSNTCCVFLTVMLVGFNHLEAPSPTFTRERKHLDFLFGLYVNCL